MPAYKLNIPTPCHEKWSEMSPTERGAFCHKCKNEVLDFTDKSANEIEHFGKEYIGGTCGKFTVEQLAKTYGVRSNNSWLQKALVGAGLSLMVVSTQVYSQVQTATVINKEIDADNQTVVIKGRVLDINYNPVLLATVSVVGDTTPQTHTDIDGRFTLTVNADSLGNTIKIKIASTCLLSRIVEVDKDKPHIKRPIKLMHDPGCVIVGRINKDEILKQLPDREESFNK